MNTKRGGIPNAGKFKITSPYVIKWCLIFMTSVMLLVVSCTKNDDLETIDNALPVDNESSIDNETLTNNETPITNKDINLMLPQDWVVLNNSFTDPSSNITGMAWKKIDGPAVYSLGYTNSEYTVMYGLVEGNYKFELTVNYLDGSISKDTTNVSLHDVSIIPQSAKEIIIENVQWTFPWYATLEIPNFYSKISPESLFRIFVKRDDSTDWEDVHGLPMSSVLTSSYDYFIERRLPDGVGMYANGSLFIINNDNPYDTPDVKIVYW